LEGYTQSQSEMVTFENAIWNSTVNATVTDGGETKLHHEAQCSGLLLLVVALVFVLDLLVMTAVIADPVTAAVRSIHWILGSILTVSCD